MRKGKPGPVAESAFRSGILGAAVGGLATLVGLYWIGVSPLIVGFLLVVIFPVYLVIAAATINAWLGYGGTAIPLRRVEIPADEARADTKFPKRDRRDQVPEPGPVRLAAGRPRIHLLVIVLAVAVGVVTALWDVAPVAIFAFAVAYLAAVIAVQNVVWDRLEQAIERRTDRAHAGGSGVLDLLPAEVTAGIVVTLLVLVLLFVAVAVLRALL